MIYGMYERKYENASINVRSDGLEVEYDFNNFEINGKHQACFIPYPEFLLFPLPSESTREI